ncbi:MAG: serpin family protein [Lachnospiraceae bacterium]|nr:serpin family protein [Lachnospiraceae bacterium]
MKEKKLFDAITNVPDSLVEEAKNTALLPEQRSGIFRARFLHSGRKRAVAATACAVLVCALAVLFPLKKSTDTAHGLIFEVSLPRAYAFDDYETRRAVRDENPIEESFFLAVIDFSYETASALLSGESGNQNFSPLSLYYALAMAASGADGETQSELLTLLGVDHADTLAVQCGNLFRRLYRDNEIGRLTLANSLWIDDSVDVVTDYAKLAAENYYASSFHVDFADEDTGRQMAAWIKENAEGSISPEFTTDSEQILSIINTVYFCDEWQDRFNKSNTAADTFYLADGSEITCDFMNTVYGSHTFARGDGFTRSKLSLKNGGAMVFILPDEGISPYDLLSSPERLRETFEGGASVCGKVTWQIPKFSFASSLDCREALERLGVVSAFSGNADFSGLTGDAAFISSVRQETHIGIDENGVEASAFTKIDYAGAALPTDYADMILNRPFLYGITSPNGDLLFIGVCASPNDSR